MSNTQFAVVLTISSLSLLTSGATLAIMLIGAKKVEADLNDVRQKTNNTITKLKDTLDDLVV